jgi:hypothetical protein
MNCVCLKSLNISIKEFYTIINWCQKQFGTSRAINRSELSERNKWCTESTLYFDKFYFVNDSDAILFKLTWL